MSPRQTRRIRDHLVSCARVSAALCAIKALAALAAAELRPELGAAIGGAATAEWVLALGAWIAASLGGRASAAALLATVLAADLVVTAAVVGIPALHPIVQVSFGLVVYGAPLLLIAAACCAASSLADAHSVPRSRRYRARISSS